MNFVVGLPYSRHGKDESGWSLIGLLKWLILFL
jgi:hypothetical protein